ncbi:putative per-hexamer repeat protein 5 isoform X2 [Carassius auratus]|uniref:Per-hexamer repeat protein 5 isoform X2 n=1 Tax=Carassius auratus TaxID=7957 RepID=A0A6P6PVD3_CARAU|nr:putative per-hexamer repeat protein 5 isoform X2 [Carassius auratus]
MRAADDDQKVKWQSKCRTGQQLQQNIYRARWWESSELSDVERLWALTLRAFCPALQSDQEECIPQLPPPSSTKTVQKISDWRWYSADEDVNPPLNLPAPSFLNNPQPVNVVKNPSQPPAAESMGECSPPAIADQENHASSPDQESGSVCDIQTAQQRHLEDNWVEGHELSDGQSDKFDQVGKVTKGSGAGLDVQSGAGKGVKTGAGGSGSWLRTVSEAEGSVSGMGTKQGSSGSGSGQKAKSGTGGYGAGQRAKSGVRGSGLVLGAKSGVGLDVESGPGKGVNTGAGGSGSRLRTISEAVSSMGTKLRASGSGSGQRAKSGLGGFESGLGTNSRESGSGLGQGTKSGLNLGQKSATKESGAASGSGLGTKLIAEGSGTATGTGLGTKSGAEGSRAASGTGLETTSGTEGSRAASGSGLGTTSEAEGSRAASGSGLGTTSGTEGAGSGLECCPMCLMPFPAGFTQMQCDGHLAQCLSEMNEDIIW